MEYKDERESLDTREDGRKNDSSGSWRLEVGALLVLVKPRMLASPHADIPAMEELYTSQLSPGLCRLQSGAILLVEILSSVL